MPKLLQINQCLNLSTGKIAQQIGEKAMAYGWESWIAYSGREKYRTSKSNTIRIGNFADACLHYVGAKFFDSEGLCSKYYTRRLISQIRIIQPDIIHLHNIHDHWLNYKMLFEYLNQTDIKVVWTFHDFWPITGHCMHFVSKKCERWKTGCYDCPMRREYPKSVMDRSVRNWRLKKELFTSNRNLTIVPVSQWVGDMVKQSFLKDKQIRVVNNGVDLNVFKPTDINDDRLEGKFVILGVASEWKYGKGLEDYIEMSKLLSEDETIVLVGVSDEIIKTLPRNIVGIKRTSNAQELAALYTRADVVCSFSEAETFGMTIAEGYACGTPAVVYDNTAPPGLITPETGFVVPDKDYKAAYEAIQKIKAKDKKSYSDACVALARGKFDKDRCFEEYVNLYQSLM